MVKNRSVQRVPRIGDMEYRILCITCHYGKKYGAGQMAANRGATRHVQRSPHHTTVLIRETTIAVMTGTDGVDTLV